MNPVPRGAGATGRPGPASVPRGTVGRAALNVSARVDLSLKQDSMCPLSLWLEFYLCAVSRGVCHVRRVDPRQNTLRLEEFPTLGLTVFARQEEMTDKCK